MDKSRRRNNYPPAKPSDLDQFGAEMRGKKIASPQEASNAAENNE
ncbi:hypothetical protein [Brevibacillus fulvus]|uniref:Uncharacterized protein n=1 Tax=Brevibacillus fulvus TaxID=1125967 RepID=A0A938XY52_9BACL|nr:hypothetical protein [Brevibacillus fulvus]MBM7590006.1 hypothetical protein [Brevibacillus fulvus]